MLKCETERKTMSKSSPKMATKYVKSVNADLFLRVRECCLLLDSNDEKSSFRRVQSQNSKD